MTLRMSNDTNDFRKFYINHILLDILKGFQLQNMSKQFFHRKRGQSFQTHSSKMVKFVFVEFNFSRKIFDIVPVRNKLSPNLNSYFFNKNCKKQFANSIEFAEDLGKKVHNQRSLKRSLKVICKLDSFYETLRWEGQGQGLQAAKNTSK